MEHEAFEEMKQLAMEVEEYTLLQNDELGEGVGYLTYLVQYEYCFQDKFVKALVAELKSQLANFKKHSKIVTKTETKEYSWSELEWDNE